MVFNEQVAMNIADSNVGILVSTCFQVTMSSSFIFVYYSMAYFLNKRINFIHILRIQSSQFVEYGRQSC